MDGRTGKRGHDGFVRPNLSPLAHLAKQEQMRRWKGPEIQCYQLHGVSSNRASCNVISGAKTVAVHSWSTIIKLFVAHVYQIDDYEKFKPGMEESPDPFPIEPCCSIIPVSEDDPRQELRGHKKVIADMDIKRNQVIGVFEGKTMFEAEQLYSVNVLNRLQNERNTVEYASVADVEYQLNPNDVKEFPMNASEKGTFKCPLIVKGEETTGYYKWTTELNDFRLDPFNLRGLGDGEGQPNVKLVEVILFNWPHIFVMARSDIAKGEELLLDYGQETWSTIRSAYRDWKVVENMMNDIVKPLGENLQRINTLLQRVSAKQAELEDSIQSLGKIFRMENAAEEDRLDAAHVDSALEDLAVAVRSLFEPTSMQINPKIRDLRNRLQLIRDVITPLTNSASIADGLMDIASDVSKSSTRSNGPNSIKESMSNTRGRSSSHDHEHHQSLVHTLVQGSSSRHDAGAGRLHGLNDSLPVALENGTFATDGPEDLYRSTTRPATVSPTRSDQSLKRGRASSVASTVTPVKRAKMIFRHKTDTVVQRLCGAVLADLLRANGSDVFAEPVDLERFPQYLDFVDQPMDFGTIGAKLDDNCYTKIQDFVKDVLLVFINCRKFNAPETGYPQIADSFEKLFQRRLSETISFCRECEGLVENSVCTECHAKVRRSQQSSGMAMQELIKKFFGLAPGQRVVAQWPENNVFYEGRIVSRQALDKYIVDFGDVEEEIKADRILISPEPGLDSAQLLPAHAKVLALLPSQLDEWEEERIYRKFLPAHVLSSNVESVDIKFFMGLMTTRQRKEVIRIDQDLYRILIDEIREKADAASVPPAKVVKKGKKAMAHVIIPKVTPKVEEPSSPVHTTRDQAFSTKSPEGTHHQPPSSAEAIVDPSGPVHTPLPIITLPNSVPAVENNKSRTPAARTPKSSLRSSPRSNRSVKYKVLPMTMTLKQLREARYTQDDVTSDDDDEIDRSEKETRETDMEFVDSDSDVMVVEADERDQKGEIIEVQGSSNGPILVDDTERREMVTSHEGVYIVD
ncbi:uncharacterized protein SPPG_04534 [Spizellomyces punctatus DAOM BR117]|uniref:Bromo domain-containing protein n=1 Tax=Spizellomyces punctatus (strain DAOM BR117) TaxID=645134 RepID=A0A0L0HH39_SPIPD|nr:uncharacterized protein SPPG_04534 [Spizellomyces punctatus DAOM BR117]KND00195.1 hypothetical protein SPPG_04534 [Spizellomyces punctatus DAOM BR117]|eukprot:XP_016608234.1 hypothetical protein SPPG_04534 [Spizellomyces punctatus DAOM BR117]